MDEHKAPSAFHHVLKNEKGAVAVVISLLFVVLIGFVGLAIDVGMWYSQQQRLQFAADAAAVAAAFEISAGNSAEVAADHALAEAKNSGFKSNECSLNSDNGVCSVYIPPRKLGFETNSNAVEVVLREDGVQFLSSMFVDNPNIMVRSIMSAGGISASFCILGLDANDSKTVFLNNNASINCGVASGSSSSASFYLENNAVVDGSVYVVGSAYLKNNSKINGNVYASNIAGQNNFTINGDIVLGNYAAIQDPYADFEPGNTDLTQICSSLPASLSNNKTMTYVPGRFCNGWSFQNNITVNLDPGVYTIESKLIIKNNVNINATGGVTLVLKGDYTMDVGNNARINITAPNYGTYKGIAMYGMRQNAENSGSEIIQIFQNNATVNIVGAIYFPTQKILFDNNSVTSQTDCTQLVARKIEIRNNAALGMNCSGIGANNISLKSRKIKTLY